MNAVHVNTQTLRTHFSRVLYAQHGAECQKQVKKNPKSSHKQEHWQFFGQEVLNSLKQNWIPSLNPLIYAFIDNFLTLREGCCYFSALLIHQEKRLSKERMDQ